MNHHRFTKKYVRAPTQPHHSQQHMVTKSSNSSCFLRRTFAIILTAVALLPCSSFVYYNDMKIAPRAPLPKTSLMASTSDNDKPTSADVEPDDYFNFGQTKDALKNVASTFSSEVKKNFQSAADVVTSRGNADVKEFEKNIQYATEAASSGFSSAARRGSQDVLTFADNAFTNAKKVAELSTDGLRETSLLAAEFATKGTGDVLRLTEQGILDIQLLSKNGTERVGDVAKWIDTQAKSGSELVGSTAKSLVLDFTGKEQYNFGDISNELVRRIATKEIAIQDTILVIKILVALGASIGPLAKVLPLTVLLEALNVSLEQKIGGKVLEALALSIDNRIVAAFSSDDKVQLGDAVKRTVLSGVLSFTGKSKYESGDIQRVIEQNEGDYSDELSQLNLNVNSDLLEWDRLFVERCLESTQTANSADAKDLDIKISLALEECAKLEEKEKPVKNGIGARDDYFSQLGR